MGVTRVSEVAIDWFRKTFGTRLRSRDYTREVKLARDSTKLETSVGKRLIQKSSYLLFI